jgi:hypothetical protein
MSTATVPPHAKDKSPNLDNLTFARKEGWRDAVEAPKRVSPELLSTRQIRRLSDAAADIYNQRRTDWHNNLGPFKTPQLVALHDDLWDILDANTQDGNRAKGAVALDGYPGLGADPVTGHRKLPLRSSEAAALANWFRRCTQRYVAKITVGPRRSRRQDQHDRNAVAVANRSM